MELWALLAPETAFALTALAHCRALELLFDDGLGAVGRGVFAEREERCAAAAGEPGRCLRLRRC